MKVAALLPGLVLCGLLIGCHSSRPTAANASPARSERQYAEETEARAQDLYKTGQVASIAEARAQAASEANQQWYAAAKARERQADQEKFEKDFKKSQASSP